MPRARKHIVCLSETPYYHVSSRCVRRAFLCGTDKFTGRSYEHRRIWIEDRIRVLSSLFSIELCAYAVMSNHYHLVVRIDPDEPARWSDDEVLSRWTALFRGPVLVQRYRANEPLRAAECETLASIAAVFRARLGSLSWFMKCLNEPIARKANLEDGCTGHFWEARFDSQPLTSERALVVAMAYVDLNPIRSKIAKTPETSDYTSIKSRIEGGYRMSTLVRAVSGMLERKELNHFDTPIRPLRPFSAAMTEGIERPTNTDALPMREIEYVKLVDETGRIAVCGKPGSIDPELQPILNRLGLTVLQWAEASTAFEAYYRGGDLRLAIST